MLPLPPDPVLFSVGPLNVGWYGLLYAVGLFAVYQFMMREAKRRKLDAELIANGLIIISIAALVGGRLYHVIDAWDRYSLNLIGALIPPYAGLGAPGGIVTGVIALAISFTESKSTSPQIPSPSRLIPISITTAPGRTISAVIARALPIATINISARRVTLAKSTVLL